MKFPHLTFRRIHTSVAQLWLVSLLCALILTIAATIYAIATLIDAFGADVARDSEGVAVESISREGLNDAVEAFEARIRRFEAAKSDHTSAPDPSL